MVNQIGATSILHQDFEHVVKESPIIVDATISNIEYTTIPNSMMGYATITLDIQEVIAGECPSKIEMRRYGVTDKSEYIDVDFVPTFNSDERHIICLKLHPKGYYKHVGLYNGSFKVTQNQVKGNVSVASFKQQIKDIRNSNLDPSVYASQIITLPDKGMSPNKITAAGTHMDGNFVTWNETWDTDYLPVEFKYNPTGANTSASTLRSRINDGFAAWNNVSYCDFDIETITSADETSDTQEDNTTNVIFWTDYTVNVLAREFGYPVTMGGPGTKKGSDIVFNTDYNTGDNVWYFGSTALLERTLDVDIDFTDVLVHELGHTQGLGHTSVATTRMQDGYLACTLTPLRTIADGDKAGAVYQHTGISVIPTTLTHSIALSASETTFDLNGNVTVGSGKTLYTFTESITIDLDGYSISTSGTGVISLGSNTTIDPEDVSIKSGSTIKGQYSSIPSALSSASSGETVYAAEETHAITTNTTVSSGITLEIEPGATLEFGTNTILNIYGTLIAEGTSGNMITFDKSGASNWGGIKFYDSSTDNSCKLEYCLIQNAIYGV